MYKSQLQVLCQQKSWSMPEYSTLKDGPDHNPCFTGTVIVKGMTFSTAETSRNSKEAQNKAAKLAFEHLCAAPHCVPDLNSISTALPGRTVPSSVTGASYVRPHIGKTSQPTTIGKMPTPLVNETSMEVEEDTKFIDARHLCKSQLQNYAHKRNLTLPKYSCEREGPPHACRFKGKVTIDGKSYESSEFFPTIKEAEHAAAQVAWASLSLDEVHQDDSALYKNLLQEFAQREDYHRPKYVTKNSGPPHLPIFVSTVEIQGHTFEGQAAKSKKLAEAHAAKVAYFGLQDLIQNKDEEGTSRCRTLVTAETGVIQNKDEEGTSQCLVKAEPGNLVAAVLSSGSQLIKALGASSSMLQSVIVGDSPQRVRPNTNLRISAEEIDENTVNAESCTRPLSPSSQEAQNNSKRLRCLPSSDIVYASMQSPFPATSTANGVFSSTSAVSIESSPFPSVDAKNEQPVGSSCTGTLSNENILVYPRVPNMTFPDGAAIHPFSDDKWVVLKMNSDLE